MRPWERWILLASLKILHGHAAPSLDPVGLHLLQETPSEKSTDCDFIDDTEEESDILLTLEEVKKSVLSLEGENTEVKNAIGADENKVEIKCNSPKSNPERKRRLTRPIYIPPKKISKKNALSQVSIDSPKYHAITGDKITTKNNGKSPKENNTNKQNTKGKKLQKLSNMPLKKDQQNNVSSPVKAGQTSQKNPSCSKNIGIGEANHSSHINTSCTEVKISPETCSSCKRPIVTETPDNEQVKSKVLGIDETKQIKIQHFQETEQGVQRETLLNSIVPLIESTGTQTNLLSYEFVDKEVQTMLVIKKDKSIQSVLKLKKRHKQSHSEWKLITLSCIPMKKHRDDDTQKEEHWNSPSETELHDSDVDKKVSIDNFLFHGRPTVKKEMMPVDIPLKCLTGPCDPPLLDPRLPV